MEGQHKGVDEAMPRVEGVTEGKGRRGRWRDNIREWMRLCLGWKELNMKVLNISQDNYFHDHRFFIFAHNSFYNVWYVICLISYCI